MTDEYSVFQDAGAEVVAVAMATQETARDYFESHGHPFACVIDPEHAVFDQYEVKSKLLSLGQRPALFVIDREGVVRYAYLGWQQWEIPPNADVLDVCRGIPCRDPGVTGQQPETLAAKA